MSKVKIQGNASGTGVLTIAAPNTSTDRTITLPDSTGTILDENSSLPAANLTGTVADARISTLTASKLTGNLPAINGSALTNLPSATPSAGDVVQVVYFESTGGTNDNGAIPYQDTHLVATITPQYSNSKIIVDANCQMYMNNTSGECSMGFDFKRAIAGGATTQNISGDTATSTAQHRSIGNGELTAIVPFRVIDGPNTTSAVTYTLQYAGSGSANTIIGWQNKADTLVLTEVKV